MRRWFVPRRALTLLMVLPALALLPGCLGDDDSSDDAVVDEAQDELTAGLAEMAVELEESIVTAVPGLLRDGVDAPALREESVLWDPTSGTWTIVITETYEEDFASGQIAATQTVRFLADGVPVQIPDASTNEVRVRMEGTNAGNYHRREAWNADFDFALEREWVGVRNPDGSLEITAEGSFGGATTYHVGDRNYPRQATLAWTTQMAYAAGNPCVQGEIAGATARYGFTATFDGAGTASWEVTRAGQVVRSGSVEYVCTGPTGE